MLKRIVIITALIGLAGVMGSASCGTALTPVPPPVNSSVPSSTEIPVTDTPVITPTVTLTNIPALPEENICSWTPYSNNISISPSISENCLNDLNDIGISGDEKQISFFVDGITLGTYGVCENISEHKKIEFKVKILDNITSARFLVTVGPSAIPVKVLSRAFVIQPEGSEDVYVKRIKYVSTAQLEDYPIEIGNLQAIPFWKQNEEWIFNFSFEFNNSKVSVSMNKTLTDHWQLNSPNRYLCFTYQAMPTATQPTEFEAQVIFP